MSLYTHLSRCWRRWSVVVLITTGALWLTPVHADTLDDFFATIKSFTARFNQNVYNAEHQLQEKSSGFIRVQRPDKFNFEYTKPYHQIYIADGEKLWSYDEDLEQVIVKPQKEVLANSPAMILSNSRILRQHYQISRTGMEQGLEWFELKPNNPDAGFEAVALAFAKNELRVMELQDSFGQTTRLDFFEMQKNPSIDAKTFNFVPPQGVDVISQ